MSDLKNPEANFKAIISGKKSAEVLYFSMQRTWQPLRGQESAVSHTDTYLD